MTDTIEMVYSACAMWIQDWLEAESPILHDEWDLASWMENEMREAMQVFLTFGFKTAKGRNDARNILRALFYEHFLFQRQLAITNLVPNIDATKRLPKLVQTAQKSAEWHAEGRNMLSGHEFGPICIGSRSERQNVLAKKCSPEVVVTGTGDSRTVFLSSEDGKLSAFKWGWRYEPVARMVFERYISEIDGDASEVYDGLGRVRHPTLPRLGASPDGLIMKGKRSGRLLEIKCPVSRELDNKVPIHYYCQMQLQAEVCDVDAVEYIEVQFANIDDVSGCKPWIGKICVCSPTTDADPATWTYAYSPLFTQELIEQCRAWLPEGGVVLESSIWCIKNMFHTTVLRNPRWWNAVGYPSYMDFWKDVEMARIDGRYKPRALFLDSVSDEEKDTGANNLPSLDTTAGSDDTAISDTEEDVSKPVGTWLGVE